MSSSQEEVVVFPNVRLQGRLGILSLTDTEIAFEEKSALKSSKSEWVLQAVKENTLKPVTSSVDLKLEMDGSKDCLTFQMMSLAEVVRFRGTLEGRIKEQQQSMRAVAKNINAGQQQQEEATEALPPIPEQTEVVKVREPESVPCSSSNAVMTSTSSKAAKSEAESPTDETETTMSMSERSEPSRPGAVRVEGGGSDRSCAKSRREPVARCSVVVEGLDKRISARIMSSHHSSTSSAPPPPSTIQTTNPSLRAAHSRTTLNTNDDNPPLRDIRSDDSLEDVSEFAEDLSRTSHHSTCYGRRRDTLVAPVTDLAKDLLTPTDHQRSLNESLHHNNNNVSVTSLVGASHSRRSDIAKEKSKRMNARGARGLRRDSMEAAQARVVAKATTKEYKRVLSESKLNANHTITEKSGEMMKSNELSLVSAEEGTAADVADPYNIGLVEARVVDDSSAFFMSPSAVASEVDLEQEEKQRKKMLYQFGAGCCLALVVVSVLAALAAADVLGGGGKASVSVPVLTPEERFELIRDRIFNVVHDQASLDDVNSPQRKALQWLTTEDTFHEDIIEVDATLQEKLEQRFTLSVIYFSMTQASRWPYCQPPETGEVMACVHPVLESYAIEGVYYDQKMSEPAFRWLSGTDECSWAGVKCTDGMHVSKLQLAGYKLQGTLPIEVGFLSSLEVLDLQQNRLMGTLPEEWGALETDNSALRSIRLDQNQLSGPIPKEWCDLNSASLKNLVLSNNQLTGAIPACLSKFAEMENFSVMNNAMTGTIPTSLGILIHLNTFHVAGNNLHGSFPDSLCNLERYEMKEASADCSNIASENYVSCPCCTTCCDGSQRDCSLQQNLLP